MRLIDKDALKVELDAWARIIQNPDHYMRADALHIIDTAPEIDAVPVVRCKECRHYDHGCCVVMRYKDDHHIIRVKPTDYCSYGERKESEGST